MNRSRNKLLPYELEILTAAQQSNEGIYPYGLASTVYEDGKAKVSNGTVYKRFRMLEEMGMLEKGEPVITETHHVRIPYYLTELGKLAVGDIMPSPE